MDYSNKLTTNQGDVVWIVQWTSYVQTLLSMLGVFFLVCQKKNAESNCEHNPANLKIKRAKKGIDSFLDVPSMRPHFVSWTENAVL